MPKLAAKELEKELLAFYTLENLHEAVFWVRSDQQIVLVNDMACRMTGYTKDELSVSTELPEGNSVGNKVELTC